VRSIRLGPQPSVVATDLRACLTALGVGDEVLGGIALLGLTLPGLDLIIDAALVLPRGLIVIVGADLPDLALRLDAPIDGPWLVDGWTLVRGERASKPAGNPAGNALAAASAVAARLEAPGAPRLPVRAVLAVGPYVQTVVQPEGDRDRGLWVLCPSPRALLSLVLELTNGVPRCTTDAAVELLQMLAPQVEMPHSQVLAEEGFVAARAVSG
jgi:hypothetical protein